jgi:hypothetical protein
MDMRVIANAPTKKIITGDDPNKNPFTTPANRTIIRIIVTIRGL